jgi:elongation factor Tu
MFNKSRKPGLAGDAGQAMASVGMAACTEFQGRIDLLHPGQGGRRTPVFSQYRPAFRFDDSYVPGTVTLPEGTEMVMPGGDGAEVTVQLAQPALMAAGKHFTIHEGSRMVGTGQVLTIIR